MAAVICSFHRYEFNARMGEFADFAIAKSKEAEVQEILRSMKGEIEGRQKLILIADDSNWRAAELYEGSAYATDEKDANRIIQAKKRALEEAEEKVFYRCAVRFDHGKMSKK